MTDPRKAVWTARRDEIARLAMYRRQRRYVFGQLGEAGADRAEELDYLIAKSELLIAEYSEACATRPVLTLETACSSSLASS